MNHRSTDLFLVVVITLVSVALVFVLPADSGAGRIWTLPFVLLLPGYALTSALLSRQALGMVERLLFSLGLSMVIVILGGLILNWTPFGLSARSWAVFLGGITLGASFVALLRRRGQGVPTAGGSGTGRIGITLSQGLLLGLAAFIVCGAVAVSIVGAERQPSTGFTEFWILPPGGASSRASVQLGVKNMEALPMEYRLVVDMNGRIVKVWPAIALNQNDTWQGTLTLQLTGQSTPAKVEAMLYRFDAPTKIYRHVLLWLNS